MAKRLLIMALVAMQCASWSSASLFLCFRADGSIHLDGGPGSCSCDPADHQEHAVASCCCTGHDCQQVVADDQCPVDEELGAPCDCRHAQINQSVVPTIVGKVKTLHLGEPTTAAPIFAAMAPVEVDAATVSVCAHLLHNQPRPTLSAQIVAIAVQTV